MFVNAVPVLALARVPYGFLEREPNVALPHLAIYFFSTSGNQNFRFDFFDSFHSYLFDSYTVAVSFHVYAECFPSISSDLVFCCIATIFIVLFNLSSITDNITS